MYKSKMKKIAGYDVCLPVGRLYQATNEKKTFRCPTKKSAVNVYIKDLTTNDVVKTIRVKVADLDFFYQCFQNASW